MKRIPLFLYIYIWLMASVSASAAALLPEDVGLQSEKLTIADSKTCAFMSIPVDPDTISVGELGLEVEAFSFFKDNEFEGEHSKGYSLPGLWIQPRLTYRPIAAIDLEAGFHAAIFDGANKYPCYAYHDIGTWKGNQYQRGAHVLPFFRATARLKACTFVLGDLYGASAHGIVEPLFNPELNLTQDPEMGFQLKVDLPRYRMDAWVNWQSYIFEEDTHQEAFTVGLVQRIALTPPPSTVPSADGRFDTSKNAQPSSFNLYIPIDILVQHRGGEQDITNLGVQTLCNMAAGIGMRWNHGGRALQGISAELLGLAAWQQSGQLWPFDIGGGVSLSAKADMWKGFRLLGGFTYIKDFVSLYGVPFYSTISQKHGGRFNHIMAPHIGVEWSHVFARRYVLGAKVDAYPCSAGKLTRMVTDPQTTQPVPVTDPAAFSNNFSFGLYFRCVPRFILKHGVR